MNAPLPKIATLTYELTLPSSGKKFSYRPMKSGERKALLIAMEMRDPSQIAFSVRQLITACVDNIKVDKLTTFDCEWIFLQLVIASIRTHLQLDCRIKDRESECDACGKERGVRVDLQNAKIFPPVLKSKKDLTIQIDSNVGVKLRYPTEQNLLELDLISTEHSDLEKMTDLVALSIDSVFDEKGNYDFAKYTKEQKLDWLEHLSPEVMDKLEAFVSALPRLTLDVTIVCPKCKFEAQKRLEGLADFFV